VPSFRRRASVLDAGGVDEPPREPDRSSDAAKARSLAEEAEAEAAEAEAIAAAARARARAIRLRRQAEVAEGEAPGTAAAESVEAPETDQATETPDIDEAAAPDTTSVDSGETTEEVDDAADRLAEVAIDESPADEPAPSRRRWALGRILKIAAVSLAILCTCALIAASGYMVWNNRQDTHEQQLSAEFAAAGRQSVVTLMSLNFNTAQADVQRIIDNSTGQFKEDFQSQAEDFVKVAQESKVITEVTVNATAVESMSDDSAVVLVAAASRVTNAAGAKQEPRSWRLSVNLQREGEQIKMSKVEFVP
jgi:Mce-associated membrane protein